MSIDSNLIRTSGWRQGSILTVEDSRAIVPSIGSTSRLVLVSHDCDIIHAGTREPFAELCEAEPEGKLDGNYTYGKNPRLLHVPLQIGTSRVAHAIHASKRQLIDRSLLERLRPDKDAKIEAGQLRILTRWLAKRYERAAFPDRFNERLAAAVPKIRDTLRNDGQLLSGIMLSFKPDGELAVDEVYEVFVVGLMQKEIFEIEGNRTRGLHCITNVAAAMGTCKGLDVVEFDLLSEDDFTLHDLCVFVEYSCEDLSFADDGASPTLPRQR